MASQILWFSLLASICFSGVLCRNSFYEQYFSRYHHKGHSTTEGLESSTKDVTPEGENLSSVTGDITPKQTASSTDDDYKVENLKHSTTDDRETSVISNATFLHYDAYRKERTEPIVIVIIVSCCVGFSFVVSIICCCCSKCGRRERRGLILGNRVETSPQMLVQQSGVVPYPQQPGFIQQYPPQYPTEWAQQFPPMYQPQLMQQQPQFSPGQPEFHHSTTYYNPPQAPQPLPPPPPYEFNHV